jgi:glycogen debranching enzyme
MEVSTLRENETYTLKSEESFAIFDALGNIEAGGEEGLYYKGTRFLSRYELFLYSFRPVLLSSAIKEDNTLFTIDLTNPDIFLNEKLVIPKGCVHILRNKFLYKNSCYERIHIENFSLSPIEFTLSFFFEGDFADIFEIRGFKRKQRGEFLPPLTERTKIVFGYKGIDGVIRKTQIMFSHPAINLSSKQAEFGIKLKPKESYTLHIVIHCLVGEEKPEELSYKKALFYITHRLKCWEESTCKISTSNEQFNQWLKRSLADIIMLLTETEKGPYPFAGIPWFTTPFGRDAIITALECLWINPEIAKGTLAFLAETQAKEFDPEKDAEPGKIIHEIRKGELASAGEVPFALYYGSIDATPLFVILAGKYLERTGDVEFIKKIWENIVLAMEWIKKYGDLDGDGFVEYVPSEKGLINKGWKDSFDSVFYEDGSFPEPPIALVEVQGYVYYAKRKAAKLAEALDKKELAQKWRKEARELRKKIEEIFWCEEIGCYALALDGKKRLCRVRTSNAGHLLFAKAVESSRARKLGELFFEKHFFSGWGIRTLSSLEKRFNPLSYHNGSVWPHDNAIIAYGFAKYRLKNYTLKLLQSLFEASTFFKLHRIPELFCGFRRRPNEGPTHYPVACHPQAWSAGTVFFMLQACLGINFKENHLFLHYPTLPPFLQEVWIQNLKLKKGKVDLHFKRYEKDVVVNVLNKEGDVKIFIEK